MHRNIIQLALAFVASPMMAQVVLGKPMSDSANAARESVAKIDLLQCANSTLVGRDGDVPAVEAGAEPSAVVDEDDNDDEPYVDAFNAPRYWPCSNDTSCDFGYTCQTGLCKLGCGKNEDCAPQHKCDRGHCIRSNGRVCKELRRSCWSDEACCSGTCEGWFFRRCTSSARHA